VSQTAYINVWDLCDVYLRNQHCLCKLLWVRVWLTYTTQISVDDLLRLNIRALIVCFTGNQSNISLVLL